MSRVKALSAGEETLPASTPTFGSRVTVAVSRVPKIVYGVSAMLILTLWVTRSVSADSLYLYCYALLACLGAVALNLLMGTVGQVSLGTAGFLAVGAFSTCALISAGAPLPVVLIGSSLAAGVIGALVGLPALRLRGLHLALATLAAYFIIFYVVDQYQRATVGETGFQIDTLFAGHGLRGGLVYWAWVLVAALSLLMIIVVAVTRGKAGRALRMIRDHEGAAPALGIPVTMYKLGAFVGSSMIIGLEGALLAYFTGSVMSDNFTLLLSVSYLAMIVIGGLDSIFGAVVGAFLLILLPTVVPNLVGVVANKPSNGAAIATCVYGALVILVCVMAPRGIVGGLRSGWAAVRRRWMPNGMAWLPSAGVASGSDRTE